MTSLLSLSLSCVVQVTTMAGSGEAGRLDGEGSGIQFDHPWAVALDPCSGRLLVSELDETGE